MVIRVAGAIGDERGVEAEGRGDVGAVGAVGGVVAAEEGRGVAKEARTHGVALAGDGIGAGAGAADVAGQQREVDDGLCGARGLVALVDAHGPPEGDTFARGDDVDEAVERGDGDARFGGGVLGRKGRDEGGEGVVVRGVRGDKDGVHGAARDEEMGETVEEGKIGFRSEGDVEGGGLGGLGGARIHDDDLGLAAIHHHALPHDGVGDAGVGADENEGVALLEIGVGEGRGVEAEGLFVGDVRGGHALARVAVAVERAHAEFEEGAEQGHLFGHDLAGAEEGDGVRAAVALNGFEAIGEGGEGGRPVDGGERGAAGGAEERGGRAVGGGEGGEGFPAFRAGHAEVDGVVGVGGEVDGLALGIEVDAERAAGAAKAAHGVGGRDGSETGGDAAEGGGVLHERGGHRTGAGVKEIFERSGNIHAAGWPGIFGASPARKKRARSASSPARRRGRKSGSGATKSKMTVESARRSRVRTARARGPRWRREETTSGKKVRDSHASLTMRATVAARGATGARAKRVEVPKKRGAV